MTDTKKSTDIPVTQEMLYGVRDELKSGIASQSLEIESVKSQVSSVDSKVSSVDSKVSSVKSEVNSLREEMNSKFDKVQSQLQLMLSKMEEQNAKINRVLTLKEEQETRNKYVLDGYASLNDRIEKVEKSVQSSD